ncbi:MAG: hypothetical protein IPK16_05265 [Anaerolineales bacterium]|nr:hypothetical protein [Anaerolineales bacterium]
MFETVELEALAAESAVVIEVGAWIRSTAHGAVKAALMASAFTAEMRSPPPLPPQIPA